MKKNIRYTIDNSLCCGCGVCKDMCPSSAISIVAKDGLFVPIIDSVKCKNDKGCHRCIDACPGVGVKLNSLASSLFTDNTVNVDTHVGHYLNCYTGYSNNIDIRYHSASGGLISQLLIWLLEKKYIDGAVVTSFDNSKPLMVSSFIATTPEDIIKAKSSKYAPVTLSNAISDIKNSIGNRFVIVGLPCHIQGFRKAELIDKKFKEKIIGYFGIYCSSGRSFFLTEYVMKERGIDRNTLSYFAYRDNGCLGNMVAKYAKNGVQKLCEEPFQSYYHPLRSFFIPKRCLLCVDHYAELADVSFGDIHIDPFKRDKIGVNSMVLRNKFWLDLVQEAVNDGVITLEDLSIEILKSSQKMAYKKKGRNVNFIKYLQMRGSATPDVDSINNAKVKFTTVIDYWQNRVQQYIGFHKSLWFLIKFLKSKVKIN